jgi:hypothetical protein
MTITHDTGIVVGTCFLMRAEHETPTEGKESGYPEYRPEYSEYLPDESPEHRRRRGKNRIFVRRCGAKSMKYFSLPVIQLGLSISGRCTLAGVNRHE